MDRSRRRDARGDVHGHVSGGQNARRGHVYVGIGRPVCGRLGGRRSARRRRAKRCRRHGALRWLVGSRQASVTATSRWVAPRRGAKHPARRTGRWTDKWTAAAAICTAAKHTTATAASSESSSCPRCTKRKSSSTAGWPTTTVGARRAPAAALADH
jgi:hypothetical protein